MMKKISLWSSKKAESGQAIVLIALVVVALTGMLGLVLDGGGLFFLHRDTQNAVDAALVAASYAMCTSSTSDPAYARRIREAGENAALVNGFRNGVNGTTVHILPNESEPDWLPPDAEDAQYVRATITAVKPAYFIQLVYNGPMNVTSTGTAFCKRAGTTALPPAGLVSLRLDNGCSSNANVTALNSGGNSTVRVHDSAVFVNSSNPDCAIRLHGGGRLFADGGCMVVGGVSGTPNCTVSHPSPWDTLPLRDFDPPDDACSLPVQSHSGDGTITPGHYGSLDVKPSDSLHFEPGLYCIESMWYKGDIDGIGVIIYMPPGNGGWRANSQATANMQGPTTANCIDNVTCPYAGLLLWSDAASEAETEQSGEIHFNGGSSGTNRGLIYAPRSICQLEGGADSTYYGQVVCWGYRTEGGSDLDIYYERPDFLMTPPEVSITE